MIGPARLARLRYLVMLLAIGWAMAIPIVFASGLQRPLVVPLCILLMAVMTCGGLLLASSKPQSPLTVVGLILGFIGIGAALLYRDGLGAAFARMSVNRASDREWLELSFAVLGLLSGFSWILLSAARRSLTVPLWALLIPIAAAMIWILGPQAEWVHLLAPLALLASAQLIGWRVMRALIGHSPNQVPLARVVSLSVGLAVVSMVWLALAVAHLLSAPFLIASLVFLALPALWSDWRSLRPSIVAAHYALSRGIELRSRAISIACGYVLAGIGLMGLASALAPDVSYDSVLAHLAIARRYAESGSLQLSPETTLHYWYIPTQMLYAGLTVVDGPAAARILNLAYAIASGVGAATLVRHFTAKGESAIVAACCFAGSSLIWFLATTTGVDLAATFALTAMVSALVAWRETRSIGWAFAAGLVGGIAVTVKATLAIVIPLFAVVALRRTEAGRLRSFAFAAAGGLVAVVPWAIRSWLLSANPVFPLLNNIFKSPLVVPTLTDIAVPFGVGTSLGSLIQLPELLTFRPGLFVEAGELGPAWLALAPLTIAAFALFRRPRHGRSTAIVTAVVAIFLVGWVVMLQQNLRYMVPILPLLAAGIAIGIDRIRPPEWQALVRATTVSAIAASAVALTASPSSWWLAQSGGPGLPLAVVRGDQTEKDYLLQRLPAIRALAFLNARYDGPAMIWAPGLAPNRLYSRNLIFFGDPHSTLPMQRALQALVAESDGDRLRQQLSTLGITHLLIDGSAAPGPNVRGNTFRSEEFLGKFTTLEFSDNGIRVHRLLALGQKAPSVTESEKLRSQGFAKTAGGAPPGWSLAGTARLGSGLPVASIELDRSSQAFSEWLDAETGESLRLRVSARSSNAAAVGIYHLQFADADHRVLPEPWRTYSPGLDRRSYDLYSTAPEQARYVRVFLGVLGIQDKISVEEVSVATLAFDRAPGR